MRGATQEQKQSFQLCGRSRDTGKVGFLETSLMAEEVDGFAGEVPCESVPLYTHGRE